MKLVDAKEFQDQFDKKYFSINQRHLETFSE